MHVFQRESCFELVIMLPCALLPYKLGTCQRLVLRTQGFETLLKTLEQVNKVYKQQVCALIIAPLLQGHTVQHAEQMLW